MELWGEDGGEDGGNTTRDNWSKSFVEYEEENSVSLMDGRNTSLEEFAKPRGQLLCTYLSLLALTMILSLAVNLSLLMVFARKESLRTTSNTLIINLLLVNVSTTLLLLPLAALDTLEPSQATAQCLLCQAVSQVVASLSLLSTLLVAWDQYLAVLRPLRYHHHMTRTISSTLICSVWAVSCISCLPSLLLPVPSAVWHTCSLYPPTPTPSSLLVSLTITLVTILLPTIVLAVIYCHIYSEAHTSSAKNRKSSLKPASSESIYCIASTVVGPLGVSQAQLLSASRMQASSRLGGISRTTGEATSGSSRRGSVAALGAKLGRTASVPVIRHRLSSTSQFLHWEEGRAACVCLASLGALLLCWGPLASVCTAHTVSLLINLCLPSNLETLLHLPVWAPPLLLILSLLYPLLSSFIFAYRHRKIRQEVLFMLGLSAGEFFREIIKKCFLSVCSMRLALRKKTYNVNSVFEGSCRKT